MTTRDEVIVAIDLGTSACKVVAFDRRGKRIAYGRSCYSNLLDDTGRAEQDPATWWAALKNAIGDQAATKLAYQVILGAQDACHARKDLCVVAQSPL